MLDSHIKQRELVSTIPAVRLPDDCSLQLWTLIRLLKNSLVICAAQHLPLVKRLLDSDITIEEIKGVIKALPLSKAPGPDGFMGEFFKSFVTELVSPLLEVYPEAAVQNNVLVSDYFMLGRGIRQGLPLSPLLFCLAIEPLAAAIRGSTDFPGVTIGGKVHKMMLYGDDILLLVSDPSRSVPCFLGIINSFSKFSGYRMNWSKS